MTSCGLLGASDESEAAPRGGGLEKASIKVSIMKTTDLAPFHLAMQEGYFKDEGLEVSFVDAKSSGESTDKLIAGEVDIAYSSYAPFYLAESKGAAQRLGGVKLVADASSAGPASCMVVAMPNSSVPVGLLLGSLPSIRTATRMLIEFLRPIPPVAIIPLIMILLGSGPDAKITVAFYASVWPLLFNTIYALDEIDPVQTDTARSFGHGRLRMLATVALPHAAPFAFTGLRLSAAIALIVTVSTEYLAGSEIGVGAFIIDTATTIGAMDLVLAGTVVIGTIGFLVNEGLERLGRRVFAWSDATRAEAPA